MAGLQIIRVDGAGGINPLRLVQALSVTGTTLGLLKSCLEKPASDR